MKRFQRSRLAAARRELHALSDVQLKDIGLCRSGIEFAIRAGMDGQSMARRLPRLKIGSEVKAPLAALALLLALISALLLLIAPVAILCLTDTPIIDMRL